MVLTNNVKNQMLQRCEWGWWRLVILTTWWALAAQVENAHLPCQFPKVRRALSVPWIMITKDCAFQERSRHLPPPLVMLGKVKTVAWQPHNHKGKQSIHLQPSWSQTTVLISTFFVCFLISLIYFTIFILTVLFALCSFSDFWIWILISFFANWYENMWGLGFTLSVSLTEQVRQVLSLLFVPFLNGLSLLIWLPLLFRHSGKWFWIL